MTDTYWFRTEWQPGDDGVEGEYASLADHENDAVFSIEGLPQEPQTLTTRWKSGGVIHKVDTPRNSGEALDAFIARHFAAVRAAQQDNPPDKE